MTNIKVTATCDGCLKPRRDIKSVGRDSNGAPDAPDFCFLCRTEWQRNQRVWSSTLKRYVPESILIEVD